jgi:hypothetical protein
MNSNGIRFTPESSGQEDIIGDVIMGRDLNSFIHQRIEQQQQNNRPVPPQQPIKQDPLYVDDKGLYIGNQASKIIGNNSNEVQVKTIKIKFEIDFQINLNINGG